MIIFVGHPPTFPNTFSYFVFETARYCQLTTNNLSLPPCHNVELLLLNGCPQGIPFPSLFPLKSCDQWDVCTSKLRQESMGYEILNVLFPQDCWLNDTDVFLNGGAKWKLWPLNHSLQVDCPREPPTRSISFGPHRSEKLSFCYATESQGLPITIYPDKYNMNLSIQYKCNL